MRDIRPLCKSLVDFGEALKQDCPKNDCAIYLNTYKRYCEVYADCQRIEAAVPDLSEAMVRELERAILANRRELYTMWFENYAVLKQRAALGMASTAVIWALDAFGYG